MVAAATMLRKNRRGPQRPETARFGGRAPSRGLLLLGLAAMCCCKDSDDAARQSKARLSFVRSAKTVRALTASQLARAAKPRTLRVDDPNYHKKKRFRAVALRPVLAAAFGESPERLAKRQYVLYALDGYATPVSGAILLESGGYIAVADLDRFGRQWEPLGKRQLDPGPFYLIWTGKAQRDTHRYPWPWQLTKIAIAQHAKVYAHTVPRDSPEGSAARRGHRLFMEHCVRCHAINREGGRLGPDLNVPQSIVEYRPERQIRQYIQNPYTFRYGNMPPQTQLDESDIDALIAYFQAMKELKHDPDAAAGKQ